MGSSLSSSYRRVTILDELKKLKKLKKQNKIMDDIYAIEKKIF